MELKKGYKKTDIGVIPEDWKLSRMGEFVDLLTGFPFSSINYSDTGIKLLRCANIKRGNTDWSHDITNFWNEITPELTKYLLKEKDVVIAMDGSLVGKSFAQLSKDDVPSLLLQRVARVRSKSVDINFIKEFVCSTYFTEHCDKVKTSSAIPHISPKDINDFKIPLPPTLKEQKAIATVLTDTDELINNLKTLIAKKKAVKQGTLQELLTGKKRLEGFKGEWQNLTINSMCKTFTKQTGFDYSNHIKPTLVNRKTKEVIPFIQNKDFEGHKINFDTDYYVPSSVAERFPMILLDEKCFLISISGSIGKVGVFCNTKTAFIGGAVAVGKFFKPSQLDWVMFYLLSKSGQNELFRNVKAGSHQNLILDDIRKIKVPIPSTKEQKAVVKILNDMDAEIQALKAQLQKTQSLKQGMMQDLLTGKTRLIKPQKYEVEDTLAMAAEPNEAYTRENK